MAERAGPDALCKQSRRRERGDAALRGYAPGVALMPGIKWLGERSGGAVGVFARCEEAVQMAGWR